MSSQPQNRIDPINYGSPSTAGEFTDRTRNSLGCTERGIALRLFFTCWLVFGLHFATNTVREIYPALSLAEDFSFDVSAYSGLHPDIFTIAGRGTYINNNPGASMMGAIPYFISRPLTDRIIKRVQTARAGSSVDDSGEYDTIYPLSREFYREARKKGFDVKFGLAAGIMQFVVMAPMASLSAVVMYWLLLSVTGRNRAAVLLALLYAFSTPVLYRTAQLNQNILLAHFAFFSFVLLWRPWNGAEGGSRPFYFLAGLCAGWTVVLDYSGLVAVLCLTGYALSIWLSDPAEHRRHNDLIRFALGVAICAGVLMAYQWSAFGHPIFPAQSYMPSANFSDLGYRGFSFPSADLLLQTAFGIRFGLFTSAPVFLLVFAFPLWLRKKHRLLENRELIFIGIFVACFFLFCASNQYGRMQFNSGVRHIVPVVPFLFPLVAGVLLNTNKMAAFLIGIFVTYWSWCLAMYRDVEQGLGIFDSIRHITLEGFQLPWLTTLERMGYVQDASAIPILLLSAFFIWTIWRIGANAVYSGTMRNE